MDLNSRTSIKETERKFYNKCAEQQATKYKSWREIFSKYLKAPYFAYLSKFPKKVGGDFRILELCCGMGEFSFDISEITQANVLATDISDKSIEVCRKQLVRYPNPDLTFLVSDVETLELPEKSFDVVCMSGSLSCIDLDVVLKKIKEWLKPEGSFICVDTLGHNPLYNAKRWCATFIWKTRTRQTFLGIPKMDTIERISRCFEETKVEFFGIFAFMGPFLKPLIGDEKSARFVNFLDRKFSFLKKYAFKFVLVGKGVRK